MTTRHINEYEQSLIDKAKTYLPAGTFGNVTHDIVIREGRGGRVWDHSGNEYVDFLLGSGPMLIGHAHPKVMEAVLDQIPRGTTFFVNNENGILLAEAICKAVACAEKVRFTSSGSEATHYAMRLARAYRGKEKILKFEGGFHGMGDYALMSMSPKRPGNFPVATPDSAGIPDAVRGEMLIAPFNDADAAADIIRQHRDELAGVIVEPFQRLLPPKPGFLEALREVTAALGIPLIFDEVVTGFRFAYGGAQAYYGVTPDVCTLGKVVGGGFPLAAVAGRADIMKHFDKGAVPEDRYMPQIGTLSGNPVAAAAGLATLGVLSEPGAYDRLFTTGNRLRSGLKALIKERGIAAQVIGEAPLFDLVFTSSEVRDYRGMHSGNADRMRRLNRALQAQGILKGESKYYISLAHDEADVAKTLAAWSTAFDEISEKAPA
ncbi:MAG: aspartate aminotransferase family protein [Hyphomicrobiaceae bacterium]